MEAELVTKLVKIGSDPSQTIQLDKPFPLILEAVDPKVNFVQLQEYFQVFNSKINKAASEYGAEMDYIGGAAVRRLSAET